MDEEEEFAEVVEVSGAEEDGGGDDGHDFYDGEEGKGSPAVAIAVVVIIILAAAGAVYLTYRNAMEEAAQEEEDKQSQDGGDGGGGDGEDGDDYWPVDGPVDITDVEIIPENPEPYSMVQVRVTAEGGQKPYISVKHLLGEGGGGSSGRSLDENGTGIYTTELDTEADGSQIWYVISVGDGEVIDTWEGTIQVGDADFSQDMQFLAVAVSPPDLEGSYTVTMSAVLSHGDITLDDFGMSVHMYMEYPYGHTIDYGNGMVEGDYDSESGTTKFDDTYQVPENAVPPGAHVYVKFAYTDDEHRLPADTVFIVV